MRAALALGAALLALPAWAGDAPRRVVSINVCTDQLAMTLADKGQLLSVSALSRDPLLSALADRAKDLPVNHGQAEEVFLLKPDLVLAGTFSSRATVGLLRRLGLRVEEFKPAGSFADIEAGLERMGRLLGHEDRAEAAVAGMKAALQEPPQRPRRRRVALYYANSYTAGRGTLIDDAVRLAGLDNLAGQAGVSGPAQWPLERLVMEKPDLLVLGTEARAPALAYENFRHPALRALAKSVRVVTLPDSLTVCGGPFSVEAVRLLREAASD